MSKALCCADSDGALLIVGSPPSQLVVPDGIRTVNGKAFRRGRTVLSLHLSASVENVHLPRQDVHNLTSITVDEHNPRWFAQDGVLFERRESGDIALAVFPPAKSGAYTVPPFVGIIGAHAFLMAHHVSAVDLHDGIHTIEPCAFTCCGALQELAIPPGVRTLPAQVFALADKLKRVYLPDTVDIIDDNAFERCSSLEELILPPQIREIRRKTFFSCTSLRTVTVPDTVEHIGEQAFRDCDSLSAVAAYGLREIGNDVMPEELCPLIAPRLRLQDVRSETDRLSLTLGFLACRERYTHDVEDYTALALQARKRFMKSILARDDASALAFYAAHGAITATNFEEEFWRPAIAARALQCTALLLNLRNTLFADTDPFSSLKIE